MNLVFEIDHVRARKINVRYFRAKAAEASSSAVKVAAKEVVRRAANDDSSLIFEADAARRISLEREAVLPVVVFYHRLYFDDVINA